MFVSPLKIYIIRCILTLVITNHSYFVSFNIEKLFFCTLSSFHVSYQHDETHTVRVGLTDRSICFRFFKNLYRYKWYKKKSFEFKGKQKISRYFKHKCNIIYNIACHELIMSVTFSQSLSDWSIVSIIFKNSSIVNCNLYSSCTSK